jgi:hypothetical protein
VSYYDKHSIVCGLNTNLLDECDCDATPTTEPTPLVLTVEYKAEREKSIKASCMQSHTGSKSICGFCWELVKELRKGANV